MMAVILKDLKNKQKCFTGKILIKLKCIYESVERGTEWILFFISGLSGDKLKIVQDKTGKLPFTI